MLRFEGKLPKLQSGYAVDHDAGTGAMCFFCHNSNRGLYNDATIKNPKHRAPHEPSQVDLIMGQNFFFVKVGEPSPHLQVDNTCVGCHGGGKNPTKHSFKTSFKDCKTCHDDMDGEKLKKKAVNEIISTYEKIDVLVNNAGMTSDELFVMMTAQKWDDVIDITLKGFFNVTRPVLQKMVKQKSGSIVSISSAAGLMANKGQANYSAAKAGLIGASRTISSEVARLGVRVNVVAPGLIETAMLKDVPLAELKNMIPMSRIGKPDEVAKVVKFLCSDDASYITGQVISVNGGMF